MKTSLTNTYHIGKPNLGSREKFYQRLDSIFDKHWLTNDGPYVRELEAKIAEYLGVKHCIAMCNGTVALELAVRGTGMAGEVIVPSMTFIATAHALQWQAIKPVFADIDQHSHNLCAESVRKRITEETSGILAVHLFGRPCAVDALQEIADEYSLKLVYDAAHAFGVSRKNTMIGGFGDCEVFSFHATKVFNTFEGGAVTTNNDVLAEKLRLMRNFGFSGEDAVSYLGTNGKMAEVNAAMGLTNLESLAEFIQCNQTNYQSYQEGLSGIDGIHLVPYDSAERNNYQYVIVLVDQLRFGHSRDELKSMLTDHGVIARRYFYPGCHNMQPYADDARNRDIDLVNTQAFSERVLALPTGTQIRSSEVLEICRLIKTFKSGG